MTARCHKCRVYYPRNKITVDIAFAHLTHRMREVVARGPTTYSMFDKICLAWLLTYTNRRLSKNDARLRNAVSFYDDVKVGGTD